MKLEAVYAGGRADPGSPWPDGLVPPLALHPPPTPEAATTVFLRGGETGHSSALASQVGCDDCGPAALLVDHWRESDRILLPPATPVPAAGPPPRRLAESVLLRGMVLIWDERHAELRHGEDGRVLESSDGQKAGWEEEVQIERSKSAIVT